MDRRIAAKRGKRRNPATTTQTTDAGQPVGKKRNTETRPDGDEMTSPHKTAEKRTSEEKGEEEESEDNLQYEDPFPDSEEEEDGLEEDEMEEGRELEEGLEEEEEGTIKEGGFELVEEEEEQEDDKPKKVWRPDVNQLGADEVLDYDSTTYDMMHPLNVEWPCLSFDILLDKEGYERTKVRKSPMRISNRFITLKQNLCPKRCSSLTRCTWQPVPRPIAPPTTRFW
jgi:hypothetical protein